MNTTSLVRPVSFLLLGKARAEVAGFDPLTLVDSLVDVYGLVLARLAELGAEWVQFDEPVFALDLNLPILTRLFAARYSTYPDALARSPKKPALKVVSLPQQVAEAVQAVTRERLAVDRAFGMHYDAISWQTVLESAAPKSTR